MINDETMTSINTEENGESIGSHRWVTVDKTVLDSIPVKGIEKQMGFVGTPDPTTGFYCVSVLLLHVCVYRCVPCMFEINIKNLFLMYMLSHILFRI